MSKRVVRPSTRRHVHIYDEDWALLEEAYRQPENGVAGVGTAVREILHSFCNRIRAKSEAKLDLAADVARAEGLQ